MTGVLPLLNLKNAITHDDYDGQLKCLNYVWCLGINARFGLFFDMRVVMSLKVVRNCHSCSSKSESFLLSIMSLLPSLFRTLLWSRMLSAIISVEFQHVGMLVLRLVCLCTAFSLSISAVDSFSAATTEAYALLLLSMTGFSSSALKKADGSNRICVDYQIMFFVTGHMSTMWFMVCHWPQSQEGE